MIEQWRRERDKTIRSENGWLALTGLYWLKLGRNTIGSDPNALIQLPERTPAELGYLEFNGNSVTLHVTSGEKVKVNGRAADFAILQPDISEQPDYVSVQDVQFVVIQRGNRVGVRIWDNKSEKRLNFPARTWYDINKDFRIPAIFTPYDHPKTAFFPDLTGEKAEFPVEGYVTFEFNGKTCKLDINKEDDGTLFLRFWDPTSKDETYPTGRYLIADVEPDGRIFLDFNKAYNPPCAFTDFATCVFAPEQNHLDFRVTAGETHAKQED
jgi:uncharacterized protein (DUF1684 family)